MTGLVRSCLTTGDGAWAQGVDGAVVDEELRALAVPKVEGLGEARDAVRARWGVVVRKMEDLVGMVNDVDAAHRVGKALELFEAALEREEARIEEATRRATARAAASASGDHAVAHHARKRKHKHNRKNADRPPLDTPQHTPAVTATKSEKSPKPVIKAAVKEATAVAPAEDGRVIVQVVDHITHRAEDVKNLGELIQSIDVRSLANVPEAGIKAIDNLTRKTRVFAEELVKDLLILDGARTGEQQGLKNAKKSASVRVSQLLDQLDAFAEILAALRSDLADEAAASAAEEAMNGSKGEVGSNASVDGDEVKPTLSEFPETKKPLSDNDDEEEEDDEEDDKTNEEIAADPIWRRMRMQPQFRVNPSPSAYVIEANIPGLDKGEAVVTLDKEGNLIITGARLPTPREIGAMRAQIASLHLIDPHEEALTRHHMEEELLVRLGAGHFGVFQVAIRPPEDAEVRGTQGGYKQGVLQVAIPRVPAKVDPAAAAAAAAAAPSQQQAEKLRQLKEQEQIKAILLEAMRREALAQALAKKAKDQQQTQVAPPASAAAAPTQARPSKDVLRALLEGLRFNQDPSVFFQG